MHIGHDPIIPAAYDYSSNVFTASSVLFLEYKKYNAYEVYLSYFVPRIQPSRQKERGCLGAQKQRHAQLRARKQSRDTQR